MSAIDRIACKDCPKTFHYGAEARELDRMAGRTPPERCPDCRGFHRKEFSSLGCSHTDVLQLRSDGTGGLSHFIRDRKPTETIETQPLKIDSFPIEKIVGPAAERGTLLHGLLYGSNRIHLVVGPTGSGKSTWLPYRLVTCAELIRRGPICVTQPRIPATEGPSAFVGKLYYGDNVNPCVGPGLVVGYRHSEVGKTQTDAANRLIFMTDGTLLNELVSGEIGKYSVVMIDEAHERSVNIDMILSLLKAKLAQFPRLHIVIASATVDAAGFETFFGGPGAVARYESGGFTYPILDVFADETVSHWCGPAPEEKLLPAGWAAVDEKTAQEEWLGPLPCMTYLGFEGHRLRYYPKFETLVFQGVMSAEEHRRLSDVFAEGNWKEAVRILHEGSHRQRIVGIEKPLSITESIRGPVSAKPNKFPVTVKQNHKDRLVHAVIDTVCRLVERDEKEAPLRLKRWERRESFGWNKLQRPGLCGHILAFLPTTATIDQCYELLVKKMARLPGENRLYKFHREAPAREKEEVAREVPQNRALRKIILATNLAETSLTLDGLIYVVDTGVILETYYNSESRNYDYLTILHSRAGCRQRLGRVGRKEPGEGYRLYTREELKQHPLYTTPEITRSSAEQLLLRFASSGLPLSFCTEPGALMQPPPGEQIRVAESELKRLQALDDDGDLSSRGNELLRIRDNRLLVGILLCEADRFGCLWEMAIFLAFLNLPDLPGPEGEEKWLSIWSPDSGEVYEDQLEERQKEMDSDEAKGRGRRARGNWDDPYWMANVLLKQQALRAGALDDLELYLRVWQAWFSQPNDEERRLWAQEYGVSHEALKRIERAIGLDRDDNSETGMLRNFWAFDQKGIMTRDVHFEALDKVRYLYAAGFPDQVYRASANGQFETIQPQPEAKRFPKKTEIHAESVWNEHSHWTPGRFGETVSLHNFVATHRAVYRKKDHKTLLRHIVWLDPKWVGNTPGLNENLIGLAKRFSPAAERYLSYHGQWPFARGEQMCGLSWPMPEVRAPSTLQMAQWTVRYSAAAEAKTRFRAEVKAVVAWPAQLKKRLALVQLPSGPLVPFALSEDSTLPAVGQVMEVILEIESGGFIWARQHETEQKDRGVPSETGSAQHRDASATLADTGRPDGKEETGDKGPADGSKGVVLPLFPRPAPPSPTTEPSQRPAAEARRTPPVSSEELRKAFPTNSTVKAEYLSLEKGSNAHWLNVRVVQQDKPRVTWGLPVYSEPEVKKHRAEARPGRQCVVKVTGWIEKGATLRPRLEFVLWLPDAK